MNNVEVVVAWFEVYNPANFLEGLRKTTNLYSIGPSEQLVSRAEILSWYLMRMKQLRLPTGWWQFIVTAVKFLRYLNIVPETTDVKTKETGSR